MIAVSFTLGVSVDSFDATAQLTFKIDLAAQLDGVSASDIQLTVEAGSLVVAVRILAPDAGGGIDALITALSSEQSINALSVALGYSIETVSAPRVESVAFAAPSPPPLVPPSPLPQEPPSSPARLGVGAPSLSERAAGDTATIAAIAVGAAVAILCCLAGVFALRRMRLRAKQAKGGRAPVTSVVVQPAPSQTPSMLLPESLDRVLLTTRVRRLHPMLRPAQQWILHSPGVLRAVATDSEMRITKGRLYIEQAAAAGATDSNGLLEQWPLATVVSVKRRRHEMRHVALELIMATQQDGRPGAQASVLLDFNSHDDRERVVQTLLSERPQLVPPDVCLQEMTEKWHEGEVDNYTYLLHLNDVASRSFSDLSQYPIMCAFARFSLLPSPLHHHCCADAGISCAQALGAKRLQQRVARSRQPAQLSAALEASWRFGREASRCCSSASTRAATRCGGRGG